MPKNYNKVQLGQLISAIWSKYLSLQGGDVETQRQLLAKEREIFQKDKEIQELKIKLQDAKSKSSKTGLDHEFEGFLKSGVVEGFVAQKDNLLTSSSIPTEDVNNAAEAMAFGLLEQYNSGRVNISKKGKDFLKWNILRDKDQPYK